MVWGWKAVESLKRGGIRWLRKQQSSSHIGHRPAPQSASTWSLKMPSVDEQLPDKYWKQHQDLRDSRTLRFQNRQYILRALSKNLWIGCYHYGKDSGRSFRLKHPCNGLVVGRRVKVSLCLPNKRADTWYEAVLALPIAWPDIAGIDPQDLEVSHMWEEFRHNGTC